jgi:hypothetical protein
VVNENHEPHKGKDSLDNTKDTGGQEASVGTSDADALEDGGAVVVDGVDTRAYENSLVNESLQEV